MQANRFALLILASVAAAGCGGSAKPPSSARVSGPIATAAAVNLGTRDVPGFVPASTTFALSVKALAAPLARCTGTSAPSSNLANIYSPAYGRAGTTQALVSNVAIVSTPSIATNDLAASQTPTALGCIERLLPAALGLATGATQLGRPRVSPLLVSAGPTVGTFGYRLSMTALLGHRRIALTIDRIGAAAGPFELAISDYAIGHPIGTATLTQALTLMAARASNRAA